MNDAALHETHDRILVGELVNTYARALDGRDFNALGTCLTPDCEFDSLPRAFNRGLEFPIVGRERIVEVVRDAQAFWPDVQRRHVMSNVIVTFPEPGVAHVESYVTVFHTQADATPVVALCGRYLDEVVQGGDGSWRFRRRVVHRDGPTAD